MSIKRTTIRYSAAAGVLALAIIAGSAFYIGFNQSGLISVQGPKSLLVIQLTDPPHVPSATSSLNLTYTALALLVGEPTGHGQMNAATINLAPQGGSTTLDLLKLQNVSQTIALANLTQGSVIYSVTFTISGISIDVNGTVSPVALASGGNSFTITMAHPSELSGTNVALLQLNPIVLDTPSGYRLIPSAVGVLRHSQGEGEDYVGSQHQLTEQDDHELEGARGNVTANLLALSVSGNSTTITVQVNNTGNGTVWLNAIGLHGNFTHNASNCYHHETTVTGTTTNESETSDHADQNHTVVSTHTETQSHQPECEQRDHPSEIVFVPVTPSGSTTTTTTTSTTTGGSSCVALQMTLVNGDNEIDDGDVGLALAPGQCVGLTFSGTITFGESSLVLVPSTSPGQSYVVHIVASNGANMMLECVLPVGPSSCTPLHHSEHD